MKSSNWTVVDNVIYPGNGQNAPLHNAPLEDIFKSLGHFVRYS